MRLRLILSLVMLCVACTLPAMAQGGAAPEPGGIDYSLAFGSLAAIVAMIPVTVETIKGFFPKMPPFVTQLSSWLVGVALCMFGWWQHLGFLNGVEWYIALLYGLGSGLAANGVADTGLVQWLIGLFIKRKA